MLSAVAMAVPIAAFFGGKMPNLLGRISRCELWKALQEKQSFWQARLEQRLTNMQASAQCPSNSIKLYQVDPFTLMMLGSILMMVPIVLFFGLAWLALFIYVWTSSYPWLKMVGKFAARPVNLASLVLLYVLLLAALVYVVILLLGSSGYTAILLIMLLLLLLVPLYIVYFLLFLAIVVWGVRLIKWLYTHWRGWLDGVYFAARVGLLRRKIQADMRQERFRGKPRTGGKPGTSTRWKSKGGIGGKSGGFKTGK